MPVLIPNRQTSMSVPLAWGFHWHEKCSCTPGVLWHVYLSSSRHSQIFRDCEHREIFCLAPFHSPHQAWSKAQVLQSNSLFLYEWGRRHIEMLEAFSETLQQVGDLEEWGAPKGTRACQSSKNHIKRMSPSAAHRMGGNSLRTLCAFYRNPKDEDQMSHSSKKITRHLVKLKSTEI